MVTLCIYSTVSTNLEAETVTRYGLVQDRFSKTWHPVAASMIPAKNLVWAAGANSGGIRLNYDLPEPMDFAGLSHNIDVAEGVRSISFRVESENPLSGVYLFHDSKGASYRAEWDHAGGGEMKKTLSLKNLDRSEEMIYPLKRFIIGVTEGEGAVRFSHFEYTSRTAPDREAVLMVAGDASGVYLDSESGKTFRCVVFNQSNQEHRFMIRIQGRLASGGLWEKRVPLVVAPLTSRSREIIFTLDDPEYMALNLQLVLEGEVINEAEHAISVVSAPSVGGRNFDQAFFGMCYFEDLEAAERIGVRFIRELIHWKFVEVSPGEYYVNDEARRAKRAKEKGLGVIWTAVVRKSPDWAGFGEPSGFLKPEGQEILRAFIQFLVQQLEALGVAGAIEIQNEPDIALMHLYGYDSEQAGAVAKEILRVGYAAAKEVAPLRHVLGVGMSGKDFRKDLAMTSAMFEEDPPPVDYFATHPYTLRRYTAQPERMRWPDSGFLDNYWQKAVDLAQEHATGGEVWSTELGWATEPGIDLLSKQSRMLAAVVAQAMVMTRAHKGVGKFCWFTGQLDWLDEGHDYSLFRKTTGDWYPTLAVNAFSAVARQLETAEPTGGFDRDGLRIRHFHDSLSGDRIAAVWAEAKPMVLHLPENLPQRLVWVDRIGRAREAEVKARISLERHPLFLRSSSVELSAFEAFLDQLKTRSATERRTTL